MNSETLVGSGRLPDGNLWELFATGSMEDLLTYLSVVTVEGPITLGGGHAGPALGSTGARVSASTHRTESCRYVVGRTASNVQTVRLDRDQGAAVTVPVVRSDAYPDLGFFFYLSNVDDIVKSVSCLDAKGKETGRAELRQPPEKRPSAD